MNPEKKKPLKSRTLSKKKNRGRLKWGKHDQQPAQLYQTHENHDDVNQFLKLLKVPTFSGDKLEFEDLWALFRSLVDESLEPVSLKMARLRQCLTGRALEAIRGLAVTTPEYEEAKEISKIWWHADFCKPTWINCNRRQ